MSAEKLRVLGFNQEVADHLNYWDRIYEGYADSFVEFVCDKRKPTTITEAYDLPGFSRWSRGFFANINK